MVFEISKDVMIRLRYELENQKDMDKAMRDVNLLSRGGKLRSPQGTFLAKQSVASAIVQARQEEKVNTNAAKAEKQRLSAQQKANRAMYGLLGSMFLLAAISTSITGMFSPAMDAAGVFDLIGTILTMLFLPAALMLVPILVKLVDIVGGMSRETKLFLGIALLTIAGLAILIGSILSLNLAMVGLTPILAGAAAAIGLTVPELLILIAALLILTGIIAGLVAVATDWALKNPKTVAQIQTAAAVPLTGLPSTGTPLENLMRILTLPMFPLATASVISNPWPAAAGSNTSSSSTTNNSWWSSLNIFGGRDNNQPKLDGATTNAY